MKQLSFTQRLLPLGLFFCTFSGQAQENPLLARIDTVAILLLPEVQVQALAVSMPISQVVSYSGSDLRKHFPGQTLSEVLDALVSVDLRQRGGSGVQTDLSIRGSTFDQVLIVVDGVPYSDPQTGHHTFNLPLPLGAVERVEILSNGGSYRFGPFAYAGVIHITTRGDGGGYVVAGAGQYGYNQVGAGLGFTRKIKNSAPIIGRIDTEYKKADGHAYNTDFDQVNLWGKARTLIANQPLYLEGGWSRKRFGAQSFYSNRYPEQYEAVHAYSLQAQYKISFATVRAYARQHLDQFELFREEPDYYTRVEGNRFLRLRDSLYAPAWYKGHNFHRNRTVGAELTGEHGLLSSSNHRLRLFWGLDARADEIHSNALGIPQTDTLYFPRTMAPLWKYDQRTNAGIFSHLDGQWGRFSYRGALRGNYSPRFGIHWMPAFELSFAPNSAHTLGSTLSRNMRFPTFTDLYYSLGGATGSQSLQPELSTSAELSHRWKSSTWHWQSALFWRRGEKVIDWLAYPDGTLLASNLTTQTHAGAESYFRRNLPQKYLSTLQIGASYMAHTGDVPTDATSIYAQDYLKYRTTVQAQGQPLEGFSYTLRYQLGQRRGTYKDAANQNIAYTPQHQLDVRLAQKLGPSMVLHLDVLNALNAPLADRGGIPLPGRWIRGGMTLTW